MGVTNDPALIETLFEKPKVARIASINLRQSRPSISVPASGLSNLRLAIPETASRGTDVAFNCSFNLQDDDLYAIKWYRGTYEIFRRVINNKIIIPRLRDSGS